MASGRSVSFLSFAPFTPSLSLFILCAHFYSVVPVFPGVALANNLALMSTKILPIPHDFIDSYSYIRFLPRFSSTIHFLLSFFVIPPIASAFTGYIIAKENKRLWAHQDIVSSAQCGRNNSLDAIYFHRSPRVLPWLARTSPQTQACGGQWCSSHQHSHRTARQAMADREP